MELHAQKKSILYYDLEGSSGWIRLSPQQKSEVQQYCHDVFLACSEANKCHPIDRNAFKGDDGMAFFNSEEDVVNAGIAFLNAIPEMIRRVPHIEFVTLAPRIIAFSDILSGSYAGAYSGRNLENIIPNERDFSKAGTFRIVGDDLWYQLNANTKNFFSALPEEIEGKSGQKYTVYEHERTYNVSQIRKRYLPPFLPKYHDQLYKFFSNNMAARNGITRSMTSKLSTDGKPYTSKEFISVVLNWCRAYFEMTVSGTVPEDEKQWTFKLSYWAKNNKGEIAVMDTAYPVGLKCHSFDHKITLKEGDNIVGKCWQTKTEVIMSTNAPKYVPLHEHRAEKVCTIAAFPVSNPVNGDVVGVLCIDTKIDGYFSSKPQETRFLRELVSSFTNNLGLANYL